MKTTAAPTEQASRSASWHFDDAIYKRIAEIVRTASADYGAITIENHGPIDWPIDITIRAHGANLGITVRVANKSLPKNILDKAISRAAIAISKYQYTEVVALILTQDSALAFRLQKQIKEDHAPIDGAGVIIAWYSDTDLKVLLNRAKHPIFRRAFSLT